jgi:predicted ATPase
MESWPLKRFKICKLYRYKDVEINFSGPTLILIAGNGSGKTTIFNALHAFLRRRFGRLQSLDFESIEFEFNDGQGVGRLMKAELGERDGMFSERAEFLTTHTPAREDELYEFLISTFQVDRGSYFYREHPVVRALYDGSPFSYEQLDEHLNELFQLVGSPSGELRELDDRVAKAMQGMDVVYLPTYRRIENPLLSPRGKQRRNPINRGRLKGTDNLEPAHMNYGLEDVESRLNELSAEVERVSNLEYRSASATIIDDALSNSIAAESAAVGGLPDIESLTRFLNRVSRADRLNYSHSSTRELEASSKRRVSAIAELYESNRIASPDQGVLRYFLRKMGSVIERTRETEAMLQRFVDACNSYLIGSSDEKSFVYEPNSMRVTVVNSFTEAVVPLGQLSSGEKQVVSILARLYLYNKRNFILIDEPELSLSLDWQRKIVPDMINSGSVAQLLAITHSPFIFENEFDPFAGAMNVYRHRDLFP